MQVDEVTVARPLTDEEMRQVMDVLESADAPGSAVAYEVVRLLVGEAVWEQANEHDKIDTSKVKIPEEQWLSICQSLLERGRVLALGNQAALVWMNCGPAAYRDAL